jgi:hypothetical protein
MLPTNSAKSNLFPHKMYVKFNVLGALMMYWVDGEINRTHIVAIDNSGVVEGTLKLLHKLTNPTCLCNSCGNRSIFCFSIERETVV